VKVSDILDIRDYYYELPEERIAKYPLPERDQSKLLIYKEGVIRESGFEKITESLPYPSCLFYNNTKVIHARLKFRRKTGAAIEIFCLNPYEPKDYQLVFSQEKTCTWYCLVGNLGKWKEDTLENSFLLQNKQVLFTAKKIRKEKEFVLVNFRWDQPFTFGEIIEHTGLIPIPPYLNRNSENIDNERYQTIYSKPEGSVAAPTAGLHFTKRVFDTLREKNILPVEITLHVGAGTFQPVKTRNALDHPMHSEFFSINQKVVEMLATCDLPIIITGTTTLRALESLYWLAVKSLHKKQICNSLSQWEYQHLSTPLSKKQVFEEFLELLHRTKNDSFEAQTAIMIVPGYKFMIADGLITNFHQPGSTLLLLVAAFIGDSWKAVYQYAMENNFRFLSYGDSSLLFRKE